MGQLDDAVNHSAGSCEPQHPSRRLQSRITAHQFAEARAIKASEFAEVNDDAGMTILQEFVKGQFQLFAFDTNLERAL